MFGKYKDFEYDVKEFFIFIGNVFLRGNAEIFSISNR